MQKIFKACKRFYFSSPNFAPRFFKLLLLSYPILLLWDCLFMFIVEDLLGQKIPDVFDHFRTKKIPESIIHFLVVIFGPIFETLLYQKWAFQILKWVGKKISIESNYGVEFNLNLSTFIATVLFAIGHFENHYIYPLLVLPAGIVLGWIYLSNLQEFNNKSRAFWMTACFHMFNNAIATIFYLLEHASS